MDDDHRPEKKRRKQRKKLVMSRWMRDLTTKRATELHMLYGKTWPEIGDIINEEFKDNLGGIPVRWETLYSRFVKAIKDNQFVKPQATARVIRRIQLVNEALERSYIMDALKGDRKKAEIILKIHAQLAKLHGCNAAQKIDINQTKKVIELDEEDQESLLQHIRKIYKENTSDEKTEDS